MRQHLNNRCKDASSVKRQALSARVSVAPFTRPGLDLGHAPDHAHRGARPRPSRRKAPPLTPPTPQLGDPNSLQILMFLLTCFLNASAGSPYSFASGSQIKAPGGGEPTPRYVTKDDAATPPSPLSAGARARPRRRAAERGQITAGCSSNPWGTSAFIHQKMALTAEEFGALRVT